MNRDEIQSKQPPIEDSARPRIVASARRHFLAYGFRGVTMDELAKELRMSKKTLYEHFPSKTALVQAVMLDKFSDVEADLEHITSESSSDFPTVMHRLLARLQWHLNEIQPPFVRDIRREAPELFKLVETRRRHLMHHYFRRLLREGRKAGLIRDDIPTELITEILLGATQAIMNPEKLEELDLMPNAGFTAIITVVLEGVITETGRSLL